LEEKRSKNSQISIRNKKEPAYAKKVRRGKKLTTESMKDGTNCYGALVRKTKKRHLTATGQRGKKTAQKTYPHVARGKKRHEKITVLGVECYIKLVPQKGRKKKQGSRCEKT